MLLLTPIAMHGFFSIARRPCETREAATTLMENEEEAAVNMREDNPNVVSFFLILLEPNIYQPKYFLLPFSKEVGPYNLTQSNHYNINLICPAIQPLILMLHLMNPSIIISKQCLHWFFFFLHLWGLKYGSTSLLCPR